MATEVCPCWHLFSLVFYKIINKYCNCYVYGCDLYRFLNIYSTCFMSYNVYIIPVVTQMTLFQSFNNIFGWVPKRSPIIHLDSKFQTYPYSPTYLILSWTPARPPPPWHAHFTPMACTPMILATFVMAWLLALSTPKYKNSPGSTLSLPSFLVPVCGYQVCHHPSILWTGHVHIPQPGLLGSSIHCTLSSTCLSSTVQDDQLTTAFSRCSQTKVFLSQ